MTHLLLLSRHGVVHILLLKDAILSPLFEYPVRQGLVLGVRRGNVTMTVLLLELLELLQPCLPWCPTDPDGPLEPQVVQVLYPVLVEARLQSLLELAILGTLAIHEGSEGWIVAILEGDVNVAVLSLVFA